MSLPIISDDESWLDLRLGQKGLVKGLLEYVGPDGFTIQFADWSRLAVDCEDYFELQRLECEDIEIVVTRTEDGVSADEAAVTDAIRRYVHG